MSKFHWLRLKHLMAPLLIIILAVALRFTGITFDSLWLDEGYQTVVESYGNRLPDLFNWQGDRVLYRLEKPAAPSDVLKHFREVDPLCPPLYALAMNRWLTIFGGSDLALRAFSAAFSSLSIVAIWAFGTALAGPAAGVFAALLQALSPFDIAYAQEARMYSLLVFLATISGASFTLLCSREHSWKSAWFGVLYVAATWALVNTHYTGLFVWAFEIGTGLMLALFRRDWLLFAWLVLLNFCVALFCLPWIGLFKQAASIRTASFYVSRIPTLWWPIWALLVRIPFNWILFLAGKKVTPMVFPIYFTSAWLLYCGFRSIAPNLCLVRQSMRKEADRLFGRALPDPTGRAVEQKDLVSILLVAWCVVPALLLWLVDVVESHRVVEISRYVIGTAPAIFLLAGSGLAYALRRQRFALALLVCHAVFALTNNVYAHVVHQRENWRDAAILVEQVTGPNDVVFVSQYYDVMCLDRYLQRPLRQIGVSPSLGKEKVAGLVHDMVGARQSFWVLTAQEGDRVFEMIPDYYRVVFDVDLHHAIHLRKYSL
jgi:mannosyltransferase